MTARSVIMAALVAVSAMLAGAASAQQDAPTPVPDRKDRTDRADRPRGDSRDRQADRDNSQRPDHNNNEGPDKRRGDRSSRSRGFGPPSPWRDLSAEERKQIIEAVKKTNPKLADKLKQRLEAGTRRPPIKELSDEDAKKAIAVFEDRQPEIGKRLREGFAKDPGRIKRMLAFQWFRLRRSIELKEKDRELYDAYTVEFRTGQQVYDLTRKYHKARTSGKADEATAVKEELRAALTPYYEARRKVQQLNLVRLEKKVLEMKDEIAAKDHIAKMVDKRLKELTTPREKPRTGPGAEEVKNKPRND